MYGQKHGIDIVKYISIAGMLGGFLLILLGIGML